MSKPKRITTLADLTPDKANANKGTERGRSLLQKSLEECGAGRSIVADKDGEVIAGSKALEAAARLGLPVRVVESDGQELVVVQRTDLDLTEGGKARRLAYFDNRVGQLNLDFDAEQIAADIAAGLQLGDLFSKDELQGLKGWAATLPDAPPAQVDKAAELQEKWQVKPGDIFEAADQRLICGDCTDRATVERLMRGEKAALCLTDPPYNYDYDYAGYEDKKQIEEYEGFMRRWYEIARMVSSVRVLTPGLKNLDIYLRNYGATWICAWVKPNAMTASKVGNLSVWEPIVFEADSWDWEPIIIYGKPRKKVVRDVYQYPIRIQLDTSDFPCPKLFEFWAKLVEDFSIRGQIVLDPFLGSGTTLVACVRLGRRGRGIEIVPAYCSVALQRLQDMGLEVKRVEDGHSITSPP